MHAMARHVQFLRPVGVLSALLGGLALLVHAGQDADPPATNLDAWLQSARPTSKPTSRPATRPAEPLGQGRNPFTANDPAEPPRDDVLPGQVELSTGRRVNGWITTTRDKPWLVWVEGDKRFRRIPPAAVLSLTAVVDEEQLLPRWRWKGMGEPEKVYTGQTYPFRRFRWRFRLADGRTMTGSVKGQPIWMQAPDGERIGPLLLHERQKGKPGQTLDDLPYLRRLVITRRALPPEDRPVGD
jgi:hypothetical protein